MGGFQKRKGKAEMYEYIVISKIRNITNDGYLR